MSAKKADQSPAPKAEPEYFKWLVWIVSVLAVLVGLPQIYWSYKCRTYGQLCENAVAPPSAETLKTNFETVQDSIAKGATDAFEKFELVPRSNWLGSDEIDVFVKPVGASAILIDRLKVERAADVIFSSRQNASKALLGFSSTEEASYSNYRSKGSVVVYSAKPDLHKRSYQFECIEDSRRDAVMRIANLTFHDERREIEFDLLSRCSTILVQGMHELNLNNDLRGRNAFQYEKGDHVTFTLADDFQLQNIKSTQSIAANKRRAEIDERRAKNEIEFENAYVTLFNQGKGAKLFVCATQEYSGLSDGTFTTGVNLYSAGKSKADYLGHTFCIGDWTSKNIAHPKISMLVSTCVKKGAASDKIKTIEFVIVFDGRNQLSNSVISCECEKLVVSNIRPHSTGNGVQVELRTNANNIKVEDRLLALPQRNHSDVGQARILDLGLTFESNGSFSKAEVLEQYQ